MNPIEMLSSELKILEKCKLKSTKSFDKGVINEELHKIHLKNLEPLIFEYRNAIQILSVPSHETPKVRINKQTKEVCECKPSDHEDMITYIRCIKCLSIVKVK